MAVKSPDHHARHLATEEDRAEFYRTAPISTRGYWDLADEVSRRRPDAERVGIGLRVVEGTLAERAIDGVDGAACRASSEAMHQVIESALHPHDN